MLIVFLCKKELPFKIAPRLLIYYILYLKNQVNLFTIIRQNSSLVKIFY